MQFCLFAWLVIGTVVFYALGKTHLSAACLIGSLPMGGLAVMNIGAVLDMMDDEDRRAGQEPQA